MPGRSQVLGAVRGTTLPRIDNAGSFDAVRRIVQGRSAGRRTAACRGRGLCGGDAGCGPMEKQGVGK